MDEVEKNAGLMEGMDDPIESMQRITLKPVLLIAAHLRIGGGQRNIILDRQTEADGLRQVRRWKTTNIIENIEEYKKAQALVSTCWRMIDKLSPKLTFARVLAKENEQEFITTIATVRKLFAKANAEFPTVNLTCAFLKGEIVSDDRAAAMDIQNDLKAVAAELKAAVAVNDAKAIKAAVVKMKGLDTLVPDIQGKAMLAAVKVAKSLANKIEKLGEDKAAEIEAVKKELDLAPVDELRFAFVEADLPATAVEQPVAAAVPAEQADVDGREIEI